MVGARHATRKPFEMLTCINSRLLPNQNSQTDVVLLGHSMGGLLAADIALMQSSVTKLLKHTLLGTISFDTPFLGMHPGVVWSGISSIFRPAPSPQSPQPGSVPHEDTLTQPATNDPHFNPTFTNDIHLPARSAWGNALHFMNKHSRNLNHATKQLVTSHVEFGSALADGKALKRRHAMMISLDSENIHDRTHVIDGRAVPKRTRFTNYYTASTGRSKSSKRTIDGADGQSPGTPTNDSQSDAASRELSLPARTTYDLDDAPPVPTDEPGYGSEHPLTSNTLREYPSIPITAPSSDHIPTLSRISTQGDESPVSVSPPFGLAHARTLSSAPSISSLPSYTTEPRPLSPAPTYPSSRRQSSTGSLSLLTDDGTASTVSFDSSNAPSEDAPLEDTPSEEMTLPPKPPGRPPLPSDYPKDPTAFMNANKAFLQANRDYAMELTKYHRLQAHKKREEVKAKQKERKAAWAATAEENRLEAELRKEELKRIAEAPTPELREVEVKAMVDRRRRDAEVRREVAKAQLKEDHSVRKEEVRRNKEGRKQAWKDRKEDRKALKNMFKEQKKDIKEARKAADKQRNSPSPPPRCSPSQIRAGRERESSMGDGESIATTEATDGQALTPTSTIYEQSSTRSGSVPESEEGGTTPGKKPRDRKFCMLPSKDVNGQRDPHWVRVFMEGVDEVGAHCGLFFPQGATGAEAVEGQAWGDRYAWLVQDVAERIETWAHDEMTERLVSGVQAL